MKKNNQGFMLVEALVMSTVIIGVLVFMFIQFRNISRGYDRSFSYDTVPNLYYTNEIKRILTDKNFSYLDLKTKGAPEHLPYYISEYKYISVFSRDTNKCMVVYDNEMNEYEEIIEDLCWQFYDEEAGDGWFYEFKVKNIIITKENLTGLKNQYRKELSPELNDYINYVKVNGDVNRFRLVVEFEDGSFGSLSFALEGE